MANDSFNKGTDTDHLPGTVLGPEGPGEVAWLQKRLSHGAVFVQLSK